MNAFDAYLEANRYLDEGLIRTGAAPPSGSRTRREWMEAFLPAIGNPHRGLPAVQVAGTSGKGSTALFLAEILRAAGKHVGLHISPYLQVSTEKLWVDGRYASGEELLDLVRWIQPICEKWRGPEVPLHGLASVGVCLEHARRQGVDLLVMETGVGGREDITTVLETQVAVITRIGLDHVKTLGPTIRDIAWHKAGIIRPGCRAVVLDGAGREAAQAQAEAVGAPLTVLKAEQFRADVQPDGRVRLDFRGRRLHLRGVLLGMAGAFQAENAALAVAAAEALDPEGAWIDEEAVRTGLGRARLPGRLERIEAHPCPVILDGAHNPDKLDAALEAVAGRRYSALHAVFGSLGSHDTVAGLRALHRRARTLVLTRPRVYAKEPRPPMELARLLRHQDGGHVGVVDDPEAALEQALGAAQADDLVLVTGSLYLVGQLRGRFFPSTEVVDRRASFWAGA